MKPGLESLHIDRDKKQPRLPVAVSFIVAGVLLFALFGLGRFAWSRLNAAVKAEKMRVEAPPAGTVAEPEIILKATGYLVAAHKIQELLTGGGSWLRG